MNRTITEALVAELAKRDFESLCEKINGMSYEDAFKALNGFNLTADPITVGGKELLGINEFFDFNYKSLNGTIFRTEDNGCELYESFEVWLDEFSSPIARVEICLDDSIEVVGVFE
jgi:hypothetical protein